MQSPKGILNVDLSIFAQAFIDFKNLSFKLKGKQVLI